MKSLIEDYYKWLKQNTIVNEIGEYAEVTTPFLDMHNDCIQFYMKQLDNGNILLTDDGYVLSDLEDSGFNFNSPRRKQLLKNILINHHMELDKNKCLTAITPKEKFPLIKHFYIQGILAINDLYTTGRSTVASIFADDVANFLDNNDIFYNENIKLTGQSGFDHNIDYVLPKLKSKNIPERYLKVINNPNKNNTENTIFTWNDLKNIRKTDSMDNIMYVVLNNTTSEVKSDLITAYNSYGIKPLLWTDQESIISTLKVV